MIYICFVVTDTHVVLVTCPAVVGVEKVNVLNFAFVPRYRNFYSFSFFYMPDICTCCYGCFSRKTIPMPFESCLGYGSIGRRHCIILAQACNVEIIVEDIKYGQGRKMLEKENAC
jgi:hypothetical protein